METYSTTIKAVWVISKAKLQSIRPNKCMLTKKQKCGIPNLYYTVEVFLKSQDKKILDSYVWVYLTLRNSKKEGTSKLNYTVRVKSASICENPPLRTVTNNDSYGILLCKRKDLFDKSKKFLENDKLTIEVEAKITYEEPPSPPIKKDYIVEFLRQSNNKDFALVVEYKEVKVHKIILQAYSDVFKAMLASGMKEAQENCCPIVDFSYECIDLAIGLLYKQKCMCKIDEDVALEVLQFADKYNIEHLQNVIEDFLTPKLSEDNVIKLANVAAIFNARQLQEYCVCYLYSATENHTSIKNIEELNDKIATKVAERLLPPYIETLCFVCF